MALQKISRRADERNVAQFITFRVARQDFAIDATRIRGLLPLHEMTLLERPNEWVCGITSIRGHDFPVVDLRGKLGILPGSHGRLPCVMVVEAAGARLIGFIADRVSEVIDLRECDFQDGHVRVGGRTRRLLDPDQILSEEELEKISRLASTGLL
jgi:purine-binding chemotaxis protein CheW